MFQLANKKKGTKKGGATGVPSDSTKAIPAVNMNRRAEDRGFSLIELLVVVAIILIIAAIAVPNMLRGTMAAHQASAVGSIRSMVTAGSEYFSTYGNGFPPSLASIGNNGTTTVSCTNAELIDTALSTGSKSGYSFTLVPGTATVTSSSSSCSTLGFADGFVVTAIPQTVGTSGQTSYCADQTGLIRFNAQGMKNSGSGATGCVTTDQPLSN